MAVRIAGWYLTFFSGLRVSVSLSMAGMTAAMLAESCEKKRVADLYC